MVLSDLLEYAISIFPKLIMMDLVEQERQFILKLKINQISSLIKSIPKTYGTVTPTSKEQYDSHLSYMKKRISEKVANFKKHLFEKLTESLELENLLRERFSDSNLIYKVPEFITRIEKKVTSTGSLVLDLWNEVIQQLVPTLHMLWEKIADDRFFNNEKNRIVLDYSHAILVKLMELIFSKRIIIELSSTRVRNNVTFLLGYHLSKFITLTKAIMDNLCWMLKIT